MRMYPYVGPREIADRVALNGGAVVDSPQTLARLLDELFPHQHQTTSLVATFVIDRNAQLRIADRHSEHVACAAGEPVLSVGEMAFSRGGVTTVEWVSNQSTGYCPEPSSWPCVAKALDQIEIHHPDGFDPALEFRRCPGCGQINIVKDSYYACGVCGNQLPWEWNFD